MTFQEGKKKYEYNTVDSNYCDIGLELFYLQVIHKNDCWSYKNHVGKNQHKLTDAIIKQLLEIYDI